MAANSGAVALHRRRQQQLHIAPVRDEFPVQIGDTSQGKQAESNHTRVREETPKFIVECPCQNTCAQFVVCVGFA